MSVTAVRIERSVNFLIKRAIPQMLIKGLKHLLHPFPVKGDIANSPYESKLGPHRAFPVII